MIGPSFLRSTSMAAQEPVRAWPCMSTRAFIVSPPAAALASARGPTDIAAIASSVPRRRTARRALEGCSGERLRLWCGRSGTRPPRATGFDDPRGAGAGGRPKTPHAPEKLRGRPAILEVEAPARPIVRFRPVPSIRPFRALRYSREQVEDLSKV